MKKDFLPTRDGDLDTMEETFLQALPGVATELSLNPGEVTKVTTSVTEHRTAYSDAQFKKAETQGAVEQSDLKEVAARKDLRSFARYVKTQPGYTTAIGELIRIEGAEHQVDFSEAKTTLTLEMQGAFPLVKFVKGNSDAIRLLSKRGNQTALTFLAVDTQSPYLDNRPNLVAGVTELREYIAYYLLGDKIVGLASDVVSIAVPSVGQG